MAAVAPAISGGGALSSLETTALLTVDETIDARRTAEQVHVKVLPSPEVRMGTGGVEPPRAQSTSG